VGALRAGGSVFAEDEAALLVEAARDADHLAGLVTRRVAGEPLEQIVGWADFDGLRVALAPGVFVPRQRTMFLVELAADLAPPTSTAVDLCCGSGALLLALLHRRPDLTGHAADVDPDAVACARRNLAPQRVHEGDLFDALPLELQGRVDVLMVNAPYVPTSEIALMPGEARDHEHRVALDGGTDGLAVHRRVAAETDRWLAPRGVLLIEVAEAQEPAAHAMFHTHGLLPTTHHDEQRRATVVTATRPVP